MKHADHVKRFFETYPHLDSNEVREIVEEVNGRMDQFANFGGINGFDTLLVHRMFLHHWEGIQYFQRVYGWVGEFAARLHVEDDCDGHIPYASDYFNGKVTQWGCIPSKQEKILVANLVNNDYGRYFDLDVNF